jgi:molybdate transport system ATP-binding protein
MLNVNIKKNIPGFKLAVDFSISGEILAILGPSGSGKTITLRCIAGLLQPDEGRIELNGKVLFDSEKHINLPAQQRGVGFVFQNYALFPHLTVYQNTAFGMKGRSKQEIDQRVSWLLGRMHIGGLSKRYPKQLSSGQQQRVALARALSTEPEVLLLDEPFSALDTPRRERLERELLTLQDFYKGDILFVTHDLAQGYKLGSKIAVYESGRMVQCDPKQDVISSPVNLTVARLTGVKNLIEGYIVEIGENELSVRVPSLGKTIRTARGKNRSLNIDQRIILGIRPEHVGIVDKQDANVVSGSVTQVVDGVTSLNCFFRLDGSGVKRDLEASLTKTALFNIAKGESYLLYLPPERLVIITE